MQSTQTDPVRELIVNLAAFPWDENASDKSFILSVRGAQDSLGEAWDLMAPIFRQKVRSEAFFDHEHLDLHGKIFVGTSDVETTTAVAVVPFDEFDEHELEVHFSVFIQDEEEHLCVSVKTEADIKALSKLLASQDPPIALSLGATVYQHRLTEIENQQAALAERCALILNLMTGFDEPIWCDEWSKLPRLPTGATVARLALGWLERSRTDYAQLEFLLWLLAGRSRVIVERIDAQPNQQGAALRTALREVMDFEFTGRKGVSGWTNPEYVRYKQNSARLHAELDWLHFE